VQLVDRYPEARGIAADLVEAAEPHPAVEGRVLDALGHDRAAGLLVAHYELVPVLAAAVDAKSQVDDEVEGVVAILGQSVAGCCRCRPNDPLRLVRRRLAGDDVGAVHRHRDEELDDGLMQALAGVVSQDEVVVTDRRCDLDEPDDLGLEPVFDDEPLGLVDDDPEVGRLAGQVGVEIGERGLRRGVEQDATDLQQRVIAGRARARPVGGKLLVTLEDLLHHDPRARGRFQACKVAARIGEAVGMVDAQAVHPALSHERQ